MASKITNYLLTGLILSLGFGQLLRWEYAGAALFLHDFLIILLMILNVRFIPAITRSALNHCGIKYFLLGMLVSWTFALTIFPFRELLNPFLYSVRLLSYLFVYFLIQTRKKVISDKYFLISGMTALIIGYLQYFLLPDMRWGKYLGWDDHLYRLTLPHFDPTFTGVMLALSAIFFYLRGYGRSAQLFLPALFLTYSRSVWLSLGIVGLIYGISHRRYAKIILALVISLIGIWLLPVRFGEGTNLLRTYSITERIDKDLVIMNKVGWQAVPGIGLNTIPLVKIKDAVYPDHAASTNNSYLFVLITTGILGLAGWIVFWHDLYVRSPYKPLLQFFFVSSVFNNVMFYPFALLFVLLLSANVTESKK